MMAEPNPSPIRHRTPRWLLPGSLQRQAPRACRVLKIKRDESVAETGLGFKIQRDEWYKVQLISQGPDHEPERVYLQGDSVFMVKEDEKSQSEEGDTIHCLEFKATAEEGQLGKLRMLLSRMSTLAVCLVYADGRDRYEHRLPMLITPTWAFRFFRLMIIFVPLLSLVPGGLISLFAPFATQGWSFVYTLTFWVHLSKLLSVFLFSLVVMTLVDRFQLLYQWRRQGGRF